jgi:hypothetical protein
MRPHEKKKGEISLDLFCEDVAAGDMTFGDKCPASSLETVSSPVSTKPSMSSVISRTEPSGHRPCRRGVKSLPRRELDVPGDLLRAPFGNVTEPKIILKPGAHHSCDHALVGLFFDYHCTGAKNKKGYSDSWLIEPLLTTPLLISRL